MPSKRSGPTGVHPMHVYEVRPRKDHCGVELISDVLPLIGRKCEQIHEASLVEIAHRGFAIWQNPFGMLSPEVVMNLSPEVRDFIGYSHDHCSLIPSNRSSRSERLWRVTR
jgi:hypothetical protein